MLRTTTQIHHNNKNERMRLFNLNSRKFLLPTMAMFFVTTLNAQTATTAEPEKTILSNGVFIVMISVIVLLALGIIAMAEVVKAGGAQRASKEKQKQGGDNTKHIATLLLLLGSSYLFAQTDPTAAAPVAPELPFLYWGMGALTFWTLLAVIIFEGVIFYMLFRTGMSLIRSEAEKLKIARKKDTMQSLMDSAIMKSMTDAVDVEQEAAIMLDHDYDGIQELDNNLPPWWKYGFYLTIVVGIIYLFNYHVLHTGKTSIQEYVQDSLDLEAKVAAYKKSNANLVDENTVTLLLDASSIGAGRNVFAENCVACHGANAEGKEGLGPNLTDNYWIHKGGTADVFKSIKYGWTDKGMKSWQQDLKPLEIQQIVSWIKSVQGTNPANAQPPQGDLFLEEGETAPTSDSLQTSGDSLKVADSIPIKDSVKK